MQIRDTTTEKVIPANEIEIGTVFRGTIGCTTSVFLAAYEVIVDLREPEDTWRTNVLYPPEVKDFQEVEAELVISPRA